MAISYCNDRDFVDTSVASEQVGSMGRLLSEQEEAQLLIGIRAGDQEPFDLLYLRVHAPLWRFAFTLLRSREEAEDVVHDVMLRFWQQREDIEIFTSLAAYLFSAVRRRSMDRLRKNHTIERISSTWPADSIPALGNSASVPLSDIENTEVAAQLNRALCRLSPIRRQILALRWAQHQDYSEIAQVMDMSQDAVRAQVSRAYKDLRTLLIAAGLDI